MANNKIIFYLRGNLIEKDFEDFIKTYCDNNFQYADPLSQELFLFKPLKINKEDKERIKQAFEEEINKEVEWLINNNKLTEQYKDRLYTYLHHMRFSNCIKESKPKILKMLKVPQFFTQQVLKDFTIQ